MARKHRDGNMPLLDHLKEARNRALLAALGILIGAIVGWNLYKPVIGLLTEPLNTIALREGRIAEINYGTVISAFDLQMRVAFYLGFLLSSPWWIYQFWAYIAPGLTKKEKRYTLAFAGAAIPLLIGGAAFAWWILPQAVSIMLSFVPDNAASLMDARLYFTFCLRLILVFALSFLLPVIMVGVNMLGLVSGKAFLKAWRWAVVLSVIFAAVASPMGDPWSLMLLSLPLLVLYFGACGIAMLWDRKRAKARAKQVAKLEAEYGV